MWYLGTLLVGSLGLTVYYEAVMPPPGKRTEGAVLLSNFWFLFFVVHLLITGALFLTGVLP